MESRTVDYGIDLGTTNSAICRMTPKGPEIIPIRQQNFVASAVAVSRAGAIKVGQDALKPDFEPVAQKFKRLMGTPNQLSLADGTSRTPEQLSAEILKELKAAAKRRFNEDVENVVITVPAMFMQGQCAATHSAAELAGLRAVRLLQEPIAAATAFLSDGALEGDYLVYDLGGGTFDVSIVRLRDGEMNVVGHGGDNYLGGSDFDRVVVDWTLNQLKRLGCDVAHLETGRNLFALLSACEEARIALSDVDHASIYLDSLDLAVAKLDLSRNVLDDLLEPFVTRTIEIAQDRLRSANLGAKSIKSLLLVGGPTQTPYVRQRLIGGLGIELDYSQDPMTVVAKGAAIHAGTLQRESRSVVGMTEFKGAQLELVYDPISPEMTTILAGRVAKPAGFRGEIRVSATSGDFDTGWTTLVNSAFSVNLSLGRSPVTEFRLELRDLQGAEVVCDTDRISIRYGARVAQAVLPYDYGVVLEEGKVTRPILKAGTPLPASASTDFRLAKTLVAKSPDEVRIYFTEGNSSKTDDCLQVASLAIKGSDIDRTLKENELVEIRLRMDESRLLRARVYIPLIDKEWSVEMRPFNDKPEAEYLIAAIEETKFAIRQIEKLVNEHEQDVLLRAGRGIEQLENSLDRITAGEIGEAERVQKQLSDARSSLRPLLDSYGPTIAYNKAVARIERSESLCKDFEDHMGLAKLNDLRKDAERSLRGDDERSLESIHEKALEIFWEHYVKTRACWEYQIEWMREAAPYVSDEITFYEIVRRAEEALSRNDYEGVRIQTMRAWDFLPDRDRMKNRFFDAALR